jgi:hypothetical protein
MNLSTQANSVADNHLNLYGTPTAESWLIYILVDQRLTIAERLLRTGAIDSICHVT